MQGPGGDETVVVRVQPQEPAIVALIGIRNHS
jgi:hypothetical protein